MKSRDDFTPYRPCPGPEDRRAPEGRGRGVSGRGGGGDVKSRERETGSGRAPRGELPGMASVL